MAQSLIPWAKRIMITLVLFQTVSACSVIPFAPTNDRTTPSSASAPVQMPSETPFLPIPPTATPLPSATQQPSAAPLLPTSTPAPTQRPAAAAAANLAGAPSIPVSGGCIEDTRYQGQNVGEIQGRIVNGAPTGNVPISNIYLRIVPSNQETSTNEEGRFVFGNMNPGMYQLFSRGQYGYGPVTRVRVRAGMLCVADDVVLGGIPSTGSITTPGIELTPLPPHNFAFLIKYNGQPAVGAQVWFQGDNHVMMTSSSGLILLNQVPLATICVLYNGHWAYYEEPVNSTYLEISVDDPPTQPILPLNPIMVPPDAQPVDLPFANPQNMLANP